jgi:(1->4)-alpha-D-glucan 1-alpha-D-glucosylmutase
MTDTADLEARAAELGVQPRYIDALGDERTAPQATLGRLVDLLGPAPSDDGLPHVLVRHSDSRRGNLSVPGMRSWTITNDAGRSWAGEGSAAGPAELPLGHYRIEMTRTDGQRGQSQLYVTPATAWMPPSLGERGRVWGVAVQLYAQRSARNWGMGDFTDLKALIDGAASAGAAAIGVNPLHALFWDRPDQCSPYAPASRLFLNPLYLDVEACEGFEDCEAARARLAEREIRAQIDALRRTPLVDYLGVAALKAEILELVFAAADARHDKDPHGQAARAFATWRGERGQALERFATFQVLREEMPQKDWRAWPEELRDPSTRAVAAFAAAHRRRIDFLAWLQWQSDIQLAECQAHARARGMPIGLYLDLAVGVAADGADAWMDGDLAVADMRIGAPPDIWNRKGQDWGLPPWHPGRLAARGLQPFVALLDANMRHAGALRIDHALGLLRQFWVPSGARPADGAYVRFPFDDLLGLVALESRRHSCVVIGEDLGTVPPGFSDALMARGILSYRIVLFERDARGEASSPADYPLSALVAAGTHDLPTLPGYWTGADLQAKRDAGAYPDLAAAETEARERPRDRRLLLERLRLEGLIGDDEPTLDAVTIAVYRLLARTPSRIVMVQLEDPLQVIEQANLPGTVTEHPNWRRKLPVPVEDLFADPRVTELAAALNAERPPARGGAA